MWLQGRNNIEDRADKQTDKAQRFIIDGLSSLLAPVGFAGWASFSVSRFLYTESFWWGRRVFGNRFLVFWRFLGVSPTGVLGRPSLFGPWRSVGRSGWRAGPRCASGNSPASRPGPRPSSGPNAPGPAHAQTPPRARQSESWIHTYKTRLHILVYYTGFILIYLESV